MKQTKSLLLLTVPSSSVVNYDLQDTLVRVERNTDVCFTKQGGGVAQLVESRTQVLVTRPEVRAPSGAQEKNERVFRSQKGGAD